LVQKGEKLRPFSALIKGKKFLIISSSGAETLAPSERNWEIIIGLVIKPYYACPIGKVPPGKEFLECVRGLGGCSFNVQTGGVDAI
jgi:hypothetical protein